MTKANKQTMPCTHGALLVHESPHATEVGYVRPDSATREAARTASGHKPTARPGKIPMKKTDQPRGWLGADVEPYTFPAPLIFEDDDLALDPEYPPQSLRSWIREPERNKVTEERKTIYVAAPPGLGKGAEWLGDLLWTNGAANETGKKRKRDEEHAVPAVRVDDVVAYLKSFFHGLDVKLLPQPFEFVPWGKAKEKGKSAKQLAQARKYVGLRPGSSSSVTRVRVRECPDRVFRAQLNLNDILDCVIESLHEDAYSVLLLLDHDLHEDEDDDYCCGRAYGGSRAAVVSSARYHPSLDDDDGVDREHMWPASHCKRYMCSLRGKYGAFKWPESVVSRDCPLRAAIEAAGKVNPPTTPQQLAGLWMSRVARTASHELGHCLGMDHCVYYACVMQGTAGMAEDGRQPPYLCRICEAKLARAVGELKGKDWDESEYAEVRDGSLAGFCGGWGGVAMFHGYEAWLGKRWEAKVE